MKGNKRRRSKKTKQRARTENTKESKELVASTSASVQPTGEGTLDRRVEDKRAYIQDSEDDSEDGHLTFTRVDEEERRSKAAFMSLMAHILEFQLIQEYHDAHCQHCRPRTGHHALPFLFIGPPIRLTRAGPSTNGSSASGSKARR